MLPLKYAAFACDINFDAPECLYLYMEDGSSTRVTMTKKQRDQFFPAVPTLYTEKDVEEYKAKFNAAS